ncbi:MAG: 4'-phosphopantetheinyl transferase superfamily protein [Kiritimatiellia bacterium]
MDRGPDIPLQDWALPGEPFRLVAVDVAAADWAAHLPAAARARAERFTGAAARARAGASEWFKACWLPRELGLDRVEWKTGTHGKPRLARAAAEWGFNLSHAGNYVVAALAKGAAIGVDLEALARKADVEALGERVFSESERALVRAVGRDAFFALWSQKEALLKALGCGWANGNVVRHTRLELAALQTEPATRVQVWSRRVLGGAYALAVAVF